MEAYATNPKCCAIRHLAPNPSKICKETIKSVHYSYRQPLHQSLIVIEDDMLIFCEPIRGSTSYTCLLLVPKGLRDIVIIAFHSNPIGGNLNAYHTLHCLCLCYHWPEIYFFIKWLCNACPGCALSNPTGGTSYELVYHFPIDAPFWVLFVDGYSAGKHSGFNGSKAYLIAACGMMGFSVMKPIQHATSASFASGIMKIQLQFGLCHTIVLDKDSKFIGVFKEAVDLLQIYHHVLSGGNHKGMLVECVNRYLNKGLNIMTNEGDSVRVAMEAILLLLYARNSAPIPGTDISRCFVALSRKFQFPINFSAEKHMELTSTPALAISYLPSLATHLSALREVARLLVNEQRAYHREFINSRWSDPKIYSIGNRVFACRATRSDAGRGQVDKLVYAFSSPWLITAKLDGASYKIEHVSTKRKDKKHASDLSPYPAELIAFQPLDGADNQYGQINQKISDHPYKEAGIKGFTPPNPFRVSANFLSTNEALTFKWPTLAELNEELFPYPWSHNKEFNAYLSGNSPSMIPGFYTGPPPSAPNFTAPTIPPSVILAQ